MNYKVTMITKERGCTFDGRTFTTTADACDGERNLMTFGTVRAAEQFAKEYAEARGYKYIEIGDLSTPALGQTFVEIRTA